MELKNVLISSGQIIGATILDNGNEKRARLIDLQKLVERGKITEGARIIDNKLFISGRVLRENHVHQPKIENIVIDRNEDGKLTGATINGTHKVNLPELWSLAADQRIDGLTAAYQKSTETKILVTS